MATVQTKTARPTTFISVRDKEFSKEELEILAVLKTRGSANKYRDRKKFCERFGRFLGEVNNYLDSGSKRSSIPAPKEQVKEIPERKNAEPRASEIRIKFKTLRIVGDELIFEV